MAPASVKTQLSSLLQAKARVLGDRSDDDFGDLTWLTLENLRKPSKWPTARPLFDGAAHPNASANALQRLPVHGCALFQFGVGPIRILHLD